MAAAGITSALLAGADDGAPARPRMHSSQHWPTPAVRPARRMWRWRWRASALWLTACSARTRRWSGAAEYRQASLVLAGLLLLDRLEVGVEYLGHERSLAAWAAPGTALAAMLTKEPVELDVEDGAVILPRPSPSFYVGNPYE